MGMKKDPKYRQMVRSVATLNDFGRGCAMHNLHVGVDDARMSLLRKTSPVSVSYLDIFIRGLIKIADVGRLAKRSVDPSLYNTVSVG